MWNKAFWKAAAERAVRAVVVVLAGIFANGGWPDSWEDAGQAIVAGIIASLAMSFGGNALGGQDNPGPSLIGSEVTSPPAITPDDVDRGEAGVVNWLVVIGVAVVVIALILLFSVIDVNKDKDNDGKRGLDWERHPVSVIR